MTAKAARHSKLTQFHNMKRLSLFFALLFLCLTARAQQTYITATVTVTNCATNGDTFSINGHQRTWTNIITSANNQIQNTNGGSGNAATNLFYAYITYPETSPYISVTMTASNVLVFQTLPGAGSALTIATNGLVGVTNWVTWSISTTTLTNAQIIRLPTNGIGNVERTNDQNWFVGLLDDLGATNSFFYGAPMFRQFLGTNFGAGITNFVTNLVAVTSNSLILISSNYAYMSGTNAMTNAYNFSTNMGQDITNFIVDQGTSITNWADATFALIGALPPWQDITGTSVAAGSVYLTNGTPGNAQTVRLSAINGGDWFAYDSLGREFIQNTAANSGFDIWLEDANGTKRMEIDDSSDGKGGVILLQSSSGNTPASPLKSDFAIAANSQAIYTAFPITFGNQLIPATAIGTVTNFFSVTASGSGEQPYDQFNIPANCLTNLGDTIIRTVALTFNGTGTYEVKVYEFNDTIFDSGTLTVTGSATMNLTCESSAVVLGGSGQIAFGCHAECEGITPSIFSKVGSLGADFTSIGLQKLGIVASSGQNVTIQIDNSKWAPSSVWGILP